MGRIVNIASFTNTSLVGSVGTVPIGMTGYMDTTGYLKHSGSNNLTIYGSSMCAKLAVSEDSDTSPLAISAVNNTNLDNSGHNVLVVAIGGGRLMLLQPALILVMVRAIITLRLLRLLCRLSITPL